MKQADVRPLPFSDGPNEINHVAGIKEALTSDAANTVRILAIHGMIVSDAGYSSVLQANCVTQINNELKLNLKLTGTTSVTLNRDYEFDLWAGTKQYTDKIEAKRSQLNISTWKDADKNKNIIFYELLWAPLRNEVKNQFLIGFEAPDMRTDTYKKFSDAKPNTDIRAYLNNRLKTQLLLEGFGDAMLALGGVGSILKDDLILAINKIAIDALNDSGMMMIAENTDIRYDILLSGIVGDEPREDTIKILSNLSNKPDFFVVTQSLGSFLMLDTQQKFARKIANNDYSTRGTVAFHLFDNAAVYMMSNQVALLQLSKLTTTCNSGLCPPGMTNTIGNTNPTGSQLVSYVAFNDVNDLLTFDLPPYLPDSGPYGPLVNISVDNGALNFPGIIEEPKEAHLGYDKNPAVIDCIVNGVSW